MTHNARAAKEPRPTGRIWGRVAFVVAIAAAVAAAVWAASVLLRPAEDPTQAVEYTFATAQEGEVEASLALNTVAEWTTAPAGINQAAGIVTGVGVANGETVSQGQVLYTVDLKPVVVAAGAVPAFRAIGEGTVGADAKQLQQMLADLGYYRGDIDGKVGSVTTSAIRSWQKSLGSLETGVVALGDVIFVPELPSRIALDSDSIARGMSLVGGETVVSTLRASPEFTVPVTEPQSALMPIGTRVEIDSPLGNLWEGFVSDRRRDDQTQTVVVSLSGSDGRSICQDQCGELPPNGQTSLSSRVITVEPASGVLVPSASLMTEVDGTVSVVGEDGTHIPVVVGASAKGMSVVEGVSTGTRVRIPAEPNG